MSAEIGDKLVKLAAGVPILYEDNHVLVVEKPVNMPTQEDDSRDPDLLSVLKAGVKERYGKPGNVFLGLIHRLDRPVGGAMVFARTSKAASRLSDAVRTRAFHKAYFAVVYGCPHELQGTLRHYVVKDAATNTVRTVERSAPGAKEAVLDYRVLGTVKGTDAALAGCAADAHAPSSPASKKTAAPPAISATRLASGALTLVEVRLHTGRPHQIRVQFAASGCPLYGDQRYGGSYSEPGQQIALWSVLVGFDHPTTKQPLQFRSTPPNTFPWSLWQSSVGDFLEQVH
jgi:23S rRNA pseudouridine1911/1915/1917 synthase